MPRLMKLLKRAEGRRHDQGGDADGVIDIAVIARSEATKQSMLQQPRDGLLRFARNDVERITLTDPSSL
jgi:hypothetical protein